VALCVGTSVIVGMGRIRVAWVTMVPLTWLVIVTTTAALTKIFDSNPRIGFLSHARLFSDALAAGELPKGASSIDAARTMILNDRLDAAVAAFFLVSVWIIVLASVHKWWNVMSGRTPPVSTEIPFTSRTETQEAALHAASLSASPECPHRGHTIPVPTLDDIERIEQDLLDRTVRRIVHRPVGGPNDVRCC